jgi:hypothetical protein
MLCYRVITQRIAQPRVLVEDRLVQKPPVGQQRVLAHGGMAFAE